MASIYRRPNHYGVRNDVGVFDLGGPTVPGGPSSTAPDYRSQPPPADDARYRPLRKAQPSNTPLPVTFKWVARLPAETRPLELLKQFPRIANQLALLWGQPDAFREYLFELLIDRRGNRRGFPAAVQTELLHLREYFDRKHLRA